MARNYHLYVSRDIIILGISIPIVFIFLDFLKESIDNSITKIDVVNLSVGIIIFLICIFYLLGGIFIIRFRWLSSEYIPPQDYPEGKSYADIPEEYRKTLLHQRIKETVVSLSVAILVECFINIILISANIIFLGFSNGKSTVLVILLVLFLISIYVFEGIGDHITIVS